LISILKGNCIDWPARRLISILYMVQGIKLRLYQGEKRRQRIAIGVRRGCCLSPILFNFYSEYLTKKALEKFGDFKAEE